MKKYFILAAAAAMFAACSNNEDLAQGEAPTERIPLTIGAAYSVDPVVTMRGTSTTYQSTALESTNTLGIFIRKNGSKAAKATADTYEVDNVLSTSLTPATRSTVKYVDVAATGLYYPDAKSQKIDIYAYAPSSIMATAPTTIGSFDIDLSSHTNQGTDNEYMANDILWGMEGTTNEISANKYAAADKTDGTVTGAYVGTGTGANVIIPMTHRGSKIIVKLTASGMDASKLDHATVKFMVDYTKGSMDLSTGTITTNTDASNPNYTVSQPITLTPAATTGASPTGGLDATTHTCAAVILPQVINALETDKTTAKNPDNTNTNYRLIEITLSDGTTKYAYVVNTVQTFESAKVYTYNITVTASGLNLTTTVTDWDPVADINGSATLE